MIECMKRIYHSKNTFDLRANSFGMTILMFSSSMLLRHTSDINIPAERNFPPVKEVAKQSEFQLFPPIGQNSGYNASQQQQATGTNSSPTVDFTC